MWWSSKVLVSLFWLLLWAHSGVHAAPSSKSNVRVLTLNIFAGKTGMDFDRLKRQIDAVQNLDADIIALQEVFDDKARALYEQSFSDFDIFATGKTEAAESLSAKFFNVVQGSVDLARKAFKVAPWAEGSRGFLNGDSHGLVLLFKKSKGKAQPHTKYIKIFDVQAAPDRATRLLEALKPKAFIWVEYEVNGVRLLVVNTHMSNGVSNPRRIEQIRQVAAEIALRDIENPTKACPAVFCGDTNADGSEPEMLWLREEAGFKDTFLEINPDIDTNPGHGATWNNVNPLTNQGHLIEPDQRVDYVAIRPGAKHTFEILNSKLVLNQDPVSDHYGVMTDLRVVPHCEKILRRKPIRK